MAEKEEEVMGRPISFWQELEINAQNLNCEALLKENADLRSRAVLAEGLLKEVNRVVKNFS